MRREVIQTDVKESLEGLKAFVWFRAEVCIPPWWCLGNRLGGMTLLGALILSWFGYATLGKGPDIQAGGLFHTIGTLRRFRLTVDLVSGLPYRVSADRLFVNQSGWLLG